MSQRFEVRSPTGMIDGPMSAQQVRAAAQAGKILEGSLVRALGTDQWIPASKVRGIREWLPGWRPEGVPAGGSLEDFGAVPSSALQRPDVSAPASAPPSPQVLAPAPAVEQGGYVPQYGVLRSWARSIISIGWKLVYFGIAASVAVSLAVPLGDSGWLFGGVLGLSVAGAGVRHMKNEAARDRGFLWVLYFAFGVSVAVIVAVFVAGWLFQQVKPGAEWLRGVWEWTNAAMLRAEAAFEVLWIGAQLVIAGLFAIVFGEWIFAQADVASNSWRRQPLPTEVDR